MIAKQTNHGDRESGHGEALPTDGRKRDARRRGELTARQ